MTTLAVIVGAILLFFVWRVTSVGRGARKRDERILKELDGIGAKLERGEADHEAVRRLAARPHLRGHLRMALAALGQAELFPRELDTREREAEWVLAYWLMHPNELQDPPEAMELVEIITRPFNGRDVDFFTFRYRMPPGHWAGTEWLLGLSGPFAPGDAPYEAAAGGFALASERADSTSSQVIVDRYIGRAKGRVEGLSHPTE